jgi:hypothetical protein
MEAAQVARLLLPLALLSEQEREDRVIRGNSCKVYANFESVFADSYNMHNYSYRLVPLLIVLVLITSCKPQNAKIERAYYYWKNSEYSLSELELNSLKNQEIQKLYVKFFEISPDSILDAIPVAKTELHLWDYSQAYGKDTLFKKNMSVLEIVPTIFIENKVFRKLSEGQLDTLSDNIIFLINRYFERQFKSFTKRYREIQLDCDWSEGTKEKYFYLLKKIKKDSDKKISCTLRLYPYKYREKMGIPPADKTVLMCYNLLSPFSSEDKNSILSTDELENYLRNTAKYPLPSDIALPLFSWMQVYHNDRFTGLVGPEPGFAEKYLKQVKPLWYEVVLETDCDNIHLRPGDKVKFEEVTDRTIRKSVSLLKKYNVSGPDETVILFHLDENNLKRFDNETIRSFFTDFN